MKKIVDGYFRFLQWMLTGLMMVLVVPVFLQILSRYIDALPRYIWTEELARFAFIWIVMVGSSIAVREGTHFKIDLLPTLPPRLEQWMGVLYIALMLIAASVFVIGGYAFLQFGASQSSELAGLPMVTIFVAWPIAGISWIIFLVEQLHTLLGQSERSQSKPELNQFKQGARDGSV